MRRGQKWKENRAQFQAMRLIRQFGPDVLNSSGTVGLIVTGFVSAA
jgi:hypothetical protein